MKSKTIILSGESIGRGILTLYVEDGLLKAKLRLYEIEKLNQYCKLAVYHNQQVYSANLIYKNGVYTTSFVGDFNMDDDFYTALIDTANKNNIILSGGSYAGYFFEDNGVFNNLDEQSEGATITSTQNQQLQADENCNQCENCKYKEFFYNHQQDEIENSTDIQANSDENECLTENIDVASVLDSIDEPLNEENNQTELNTKAPTILESLLPQFEYIFKNYTENSELTSLLPNSKFVCIDENGENYSLGAIYENDNMKYICYAVKCNYNTPAPEELGKFYQWLPLDSEDPLSDGYYLVYQDAADLKIVEV